MSESKKKGKKEVLDVRGDKSRSNGRNAIHSIILLLEEITSQIMRGIR